MRQLTRSELEKQKKLEMLEEVAPEILESFSKTIGANIAKGLYTQEEVQEFVNAEIGSFKPVMVTEPDLTRSLRLIRPIQVQWDETTIQKSISDREGIYMDTDRNRKLGLVGLPYDYDIIKGKRAEIGEIRYYGGIPYRKVTSTGNSNKDWQRVKDAPKKPGAKGGEKHEEVKEEYKKGDLVYLKDVKDPVVIQIFDKNGGNIHTDKGIFSISKIDSSISKPILTTPEKKEETSLMSKLASDLYEAKVEKFAKERGVSLKEAKEIVDMQDERASDVEKLKKDYLDSIHEHNGKKYKKQANGKWLEVSSRHSMTLKEHKSELDRVNKDKNTYYPESYKTISSFHKDQVEKLSDKEYSDEEVGLGKKDKPTNTMFPKDIVQLFKNKEDWGDMGDYVSVVDGKLQVVDSFYYGGTKELASLKNDWIKEDGSYAKYFKEEYGVKFKLVESDVQTFATGKYKKLFGKNMGMVLIKLEVEPV